MKTKVVVHDAEEGGYWAKVPSLPGLYTQGETLEELKANVREAVRLYLSDPTDECNAPLAEKGTGDIAR